VFPFREESTLEAVACGHDNDIRSSRLLAERTRAEIYSNWRDLISSQKIDAVIVCTPPHLHAEISIAAMELGKHVLCEKPLARTMDEAIKMIAKSHETGKMLKCGFNHRHHPAILQTRKWVDEGLLGELYFARCNYGICGRAGYEKEWRADPKIVGGGQLMEQGIHVIDLFRWFLGQPSDVSAFVSTMYWKIAPLEDNAFVLLRSPDGKKIAELHSSLTLWKNSFSFDIFGEDGYIFVEGLGGSYGIERAALGKRDFGSPFREEIIEYRGQDQSWKNEWAQFEAAANGSRGSLGSGEDGLEAMRIVQAAYQSSRTSSIVSL